MSKVLLIGPALIVEYMPRYSLAMLGAILNGRGHTVKVADYGFSKNVPHVNRIISEFKPDVIGISMLSSDKPAWMQAIRDIRSIDKGTPIIAGGPHVSVASDELIGNTDIDYLVIGEAEGIISGLVESARRQDYPVLIPRPPLPNVDSLPFPDYRTFIGYEEMRKYPLLTSRGCPYNCNYCAVGIVCSKEHRPRKAESVVEELKQAKIYNNVISFVIIDDSFNMNRQRGKELLRKIIESRSRGDFNYILFSLGNFRADTVDEELLLLIRKLGGDSIWLGVESADEEAFNMIKKGETLNDITNACRLAARFKMKVILNFIIGLPKDSFEKTYASILFARRMRAYRLGWNILVAYKGTSAWSWFKENGVVTQEYPRTIASDIFGLTVNAYTADFSSEDRLNAWRLARIITGEAEFWPNISLLYRICKKYKVPMNIIFSYPVFIVNRFVKLWTSRLVLLRFMFESPKVFFLKLKSALIFRGLLQ